MAEDAQTRRIKAEIANLKALIPSHEQRVRSAKDAQYRAVAQARLDGLKNEIAGLEKRAGW